MLFTEGEPFSPSLFRLARRGDAREAWGLPHQQRGAGGDEESSIQKPPPATFPPRYKCANPVDSSIFWVISVGG